MKYTVEITKEKMVKKFIDDNGNEFVNTWVVKGPGHTGTLEKAMEFQLENAEFDNEEILDAIYDGDLDEIWKAIRNS